MNSNYKELLNSEEWKEFYNYCNIGIFKQIDFFRYEDVHTNYLASLLKKDNVFQLGTKPLKFFLELLKNKENEKTKYKLNNIDFSKIDISVADTDKQVSIDNGRLDLLIDFTISNKKYNIILENKVLSSERENQTKDYQEYFEEKNDDIEYVYVFLSLEDNPKLSSDDSKYGDYIKITYQNLIDNVLEECSKIEDKRKAPINIDEYLKGFTYLYEYDFMPMTKKLKELVDNINNKYSEILNEMIDSFEEYKDINEELRILYRVLSTHPKYNYIENKLFKNIGWFKNTENKYGIRQQTQMVLDILKDLFNKRTLDLNEIKDFKYNSGWEVVISEDEYNKKTDRRDNFKVLDKIKLEGKSLYYSCPVSRDELKGFVDFVKEKYGYTDEDIKLF